MKYIKFKSFLGITAAALVLAASSCKKLEDFGDTNVNPNGSPEVLTSALLTNVASSMGGFVADLNTGQYAQIFAEPTYPGNSLYTLPQFTSGGVYSGLLMDLQTIINKNSDPATAAKVAVDGANENQIAIARILKAYIFWTVTDRWGDVPYSEALKGAAELTPKFDEQEFIYKDLLKELTEATAQFNAAGATVKGDILYSGDVSKWKKLAGSLRMLISLRMSKVYPAPGGFAATEFAAGMAAGYIESNDDNLTVRFPGGNFRNSFYNFSLSADNRVSKTFTDLVTGLNDPRQTAFFTNNPGVPYGLSNAAPTTDYAKLLSTTWHAENAPLVVVNAASGLLAAAEAAQIGWIAGSPKALYDAGVTASFEQWNITLPANYLTTGPANFNTGAGVASIGGSTVPGSHAQTPTPLSRIQLQQYLAFYPNGIQTWSNWRRTGVPNLVPTINKLQGDGIIRRYVYGATEESLNGEELAIAVARIPGGVDDQDARMWWDRP